MIKTLDCKIRLKGLPICRGIAIGKPFFFQVRDDQIPNYPIEKEQIVNELCRYRQALAKTREDIERLKTRLENEESLEVIEILDAELQIIQDPLIVEAIEENILKQGRNVEIIFHEMISEYQKRFELIQDPNFRERFKDIQDIARRIMSYLLEDVPLSLSDLPENSIVFAKELTTTDIAEVNPKSVVAFVTHLGGTTSHAAIVAKARGIPYITSVQYESIENLSDAEIILDGRVGDIFIHPDKETLVTYKLLKKQLDLHHEKLNRIQNLPSETYDGYMMRLSANIETSNEVEMLHRFGGSGVGLFRSEYAFLSDKSFPSEDEQYLLYTKIVQRMQGLPIVIRTFDVGGDKVLANQLLATENNPYLGCRAIRFLLKESEVFKIQLSAILRAASDGDVSIMFPMISGLQELLEAKKVVDEVRGDLINRNYKIPASIRIGCMIEVPSAAIISDLLAKECDFLSIGTNDLIQYALAVDRGNHLLSNLYTPTHPSVIRLIKLIVDQANYQGIPVTICGEIAADPRFTPLLLGLGVHELSVAARYIPIVKNAIRSTSIIRAKKLAEKALSLSSAEEIQKLLNDEYRQNVPEDVFYNL